LLTIAIFSRKSDGLPSPCCCSAASDGACARLSTYVRRLILSSISHQALFLVSWR
jgi:hypothetical protein